MNRDNEKGARLQNDAPIPKSIPNSTTESTLAQDARYMFRGKRLDNGEWLHGTPVLVGDTLRGIYPEGGQSWGWVDPATLGQCTGTIDRKGDLIFEGDILRCEEDGDELIIQWDPEELAWWAIGKGLHDEDAYPLGDVYLYHFEVIGTVHD